MNLCMNEPLSPWYHYLVYVEIMNYDLRIILVLTLEGAKAFLKILWYTSLYTLRYEDL